MVPWTTSTQLTWLQGRLPLWKARDKAKSGEWLASTTKDFRDAFEITGAELTKLPDRVRKWFYYHGKSTPPDGPTTSIDLLSKRPRKVVPLTQAQAYSILFCQQDSDLHKELRQAWKLYKSGDETTVMKYGHLFASPRNTDLPFVTFQQVVLRNKVTTATEEELSAITELINTRFQEDTERRECPWQALKIDGLQSNVELERQYVKDQIESLSEALEAVCDEVKRTTNFNTFVLTGGPTPMGEGGFQLLHVGSGEANLTGQTFQQFLGPWWDVLKAKYGEWLCLSYSREEILRLEGSISGGPRASSTTPTLSPSSAPTPLHPPDPQTALDDAATTMQMDMFDSSQFFPNPSPRSTEPPNCVPTESPGHSPTEPPSRMPTESPGHAPIESPSHTPTESPSRAPTESPSCAPTESPSCAPTEPPSRVPTELPSQESSHLTTAAKGIPGDFDQSPSPSHAQSPSLSHLISSTNPSPLQTQGDWTPSHQPLWTLGPQHRGYIHPAASYLIGVPGGPKWESLLANYITFESLSSLRSGSSRLPKNPRPEELKVWFKYGRRFEKRHIPHIGSVSDFEEKWLAWWAAIQPKWRDVGNWPFTREDARGCDWGDLPDGGKDGLFLVIVSLGWWVIARNPSEDSEVDEAIEDVTWVINNLVSLLSIVPAGSDTTEDSSPPPRGKRPAPQKDDPPPKRRKATRA